MKKNKLILALFKTLLVFYFSSELHTQAQTCNQLFSNEQISYSTPGFSYEEQLAATQVSKNILTEMRAESENLLKRYKANKVIEIENLCIGGGAQCASASLVLGKGHSTNALVLEADNTIAGTFANKHFLINTVEKDNLSQHPFPNSPLRLSMFTSKTFATSQQLGAYIQANQYASGVPVLFNTKVESIRIKQLGSHQIEIQVHTSQEFTIIAKNVYIGTGLGEQSTKIMNENYISFLNSEIAAQKQNEMHANTGFSSESFLEKIQSYKKRGLKFHLPKQMLLLGNGDGARIALEGLLGDNVIVPEGFQINWVGNPAQSGKDYTESLDYKERYAALVSKLYDRKLITGIKGHCQDIRMDGRSQFTAITEYGQYTGQIVVDSTGYSNQALSLIEKADDKPISLVDLTGNLNNFNLQNTVLGRQVFFGETPTNIFTIGPASGNLATPEELKQLPARNPVALYNNIPRTAALVGQISGLPVDFVYGNGKQTERPALLSLDKIMSIIQNIRNETKHK